MCARPLTGHTCGDGRMDTAEKEAEKMSWSAETKMRRDSGVSWLLLGCLLFLRFPWIMLGKFVFPEEAMEFTVIYELGTYLLTGLLILIERSRLAEYHIDMLALALLLGAPLSVLIGTAMGGYGLPGGQEGKAVLAGLLLFALVLWRPVLPQQRVEQTALHIGAAVLTGAALAVVSGFLLAFQIPSVTEGTAEALSVGRSPYAVVYQLDFAAVAEEPLFRGFLWGKLRARGWKESRIWLFQALLFVVGHLYYVGSANISAFLVVPLGALILGLSAWRTRSVGTSMIAHGITNAFGNTLAHVFCGIVR